MDALPKITIGAMVVESIRKVTKIPLDLQLEFFKPNCMARTAHSRSIKSSDGVVPALQAISCAIDTPWTTHYNP
jgi:hypothetical protein